MGTRCRRCLRKWGGHTRSSRENGRAAPGSAGEHSTRSARGQAGASHAGGNNATRREARTDGSAGAELWPAGDNAVGNPRTEDSEPQ